MDNKKQRKIVTRLMWTTIILKGVIDIWNVKLDMKEKRETDKEKDEKFENFIEYLQTIFDYRFPEKEEVME